MRAGSILMYFLAIAGCKTEGVMLGKDNHGSYYAVHKYKSKDNDSAIIYGRIRTAEFDFPAAMLVVNDTLYNADSASSYRIKLPEGKYTLKALSPSDNTMVLPSLRLRNADSVRIDFFLTPETGPHW